MWLDSLINDNPYPSLFPDIEKHISRGYALEHLECSGTKTATNRYHLYASYVRRRKKRQIDMSRLMMNFKVFHALAKDSRHAGSIFCLELIEPKSHLDIMKLQMQVLAMI